MSKPLSDAEKKLLAQFMAGLFQGTVSLGFGALGMLDLYKRAQEHQQSIVDVLCSDPQGLVALATTAKNAVARLPPTVLVVLKQLIEEAQEIQATTPQRQQVPVGEHPDDP